MTSGDGKGPSSDLEAVREKDKEEIDKLFGDSDDEDEEQAAPPVAERGGGGGGPSRRVTTGMRNPRMGQTWAIRTRSPTTVTTTRWSRKRDKRF